MEETVRFLRRQPVTSGLQPCSIRRLVAKKAQKHGSKSVKRASGEVAVRAGSLQPDSGAFLCIHGKTL